MSATVTPFTVHKGWKPAQAATRSPDPCLKKLDVVRAHRPITAGMIESLIDRAYRQIVGEPK